MTWMTIPPELKGSCKCEEIDPDWPISGPIEALNLMEEWALKENDRDSLDGDVINQGGANHVYRLTHSHHHEWADLRRFGVDEVYRKSRFTKCVSVAWHLAGRYYYDVGIIDELTKLGWPKLKLIDFGAAPWIQAIYYAKKGLDVTITNQYLESDCNRFGRWLAEKKDVKGIKEYESADPVWHKEKFDIIYAMDVFEHIPPLPDGTPGWLPYAEALYDCLTPGGIYYASAPFGIGAGTPRPVDTHQNHYTSPISLSEWCEKKGLKLVGPVWRKL